MTHCTHVSNATFVQIQSGIRIIEPRLYDTAHRQLKLGDMMLVINRETQQEVLTKIVGLLKYGSFVELFHSNPPAKFGAASERELLGAMRRFYTPEQEREYGVIGIKLHIMITQ